MTVMLVLVGNLEAAQDPASAAASRTRTITENVQHYHESRKPRSNALAERFGR